MNNKHRITFERDSLWIGTYCPCICVTQLLSELHIISFHDVGLVRVIQFSVLG